MSKQKKTAIISILSLGVLASIATIARLPFAQAYSATSDYLGMFPRWDLKLQNTYHDEVVFI